VLAAEADVVNERRNLRGTTDRFEKLGESFHQRVRKGYLAEAKRLNLPIIDASPTIEEIAKEIWKQVEPLTKET
jgi:thymidylate kinase